MVAYTQGTFTSFWTYMFITTDTTMCIYVHKNEHIDRNLHIEHKPKHTRMAAYYQKSIQAPKQQKAPPQTTGRYQLCRYHRSYAKACWMLIYSRIHTPHIYTHKAQNLFTRAHINPVYSLCVCLCVCVCVCVCPQLVGVGSNMLPSELREIKVGCAGVVK